VLLGFFLEWLGSCRGAVVPLAWVSRGVWGQVSFKWELPWQGRGSVEAPAHRDEPDIGRMQCVIALSPGAFDVWPGSHKMSAKTPPCGEKGHYHLTETAATNLLALHSRCLFACSPGDVLVFNGGHFYHGSPAIGGTEPSPRIVTYATFWPPSTGKGVAHNQGKCGLPHCESAPQVAHKKAKRDA
jgi:hypothetical protein